MKKSVFAILLIMLFLCGCQPGAPVGSDYNQIMQLRIVDGAETGELVLAGERQSDVYTLSAEGATVNLDGEKADASVLEDGMMIEIAYSGDIEATWPAHIGEVKGINAYSLGTEQNPGGTCYDLCGLYLQVLDDLWAVDDGLNSGAEYISVDLSSAPGNLTDGEKAAIAFVFGQKHNVVSLTLSSDELAEQGYFTEITPDYSGKGDDAEGHKLYQWDNGVLFTITDNMADSSENYSLPVIKFNAYKWRSPLGAYFFSDCSAVWPELGTWSSYNVEREAIS